LSNPGTRRPTVRPPTRQSYNSEKVRNVYRDSDRQSKPCGTHGHGGGAAALKALLLGAQLDLESILHGAVSDPRNTALAAWLMGLRWRTGGVAWGRGKQGLSSTNAALTAKAAGDVSREGRAGGCVCGGGGLHSQGGERFTRCVVHGGCRPHKGHEFTEARGNPGNVSGGRTGTGLHACIVAVSSLLRHVDSLDFTHRALALMRAQRGSSS